MNGLSRLVSASLLVVGLSAGCLLAQDAGVYPEPTGLVNDYAGLLTSSERSQLEALAREIKNKADIEVAFATMDSIPEGQDIALYTTELAHRWGVGGKESDRGAMILYSTGRADGDRQVFLATGYGLEGDIPDGYAGRIRDQVLIPYLKRGETLNAFAGAALAIVERVAPNANITGNAPSRMSREQREPKGPGVIGIIVMIALLVLLSSSRLGRGMLFGMLLGSMFGGHRGRWGGGGGFGGGGFGGGFGGFGGGGFGGGGAGGSF